MEEENGLNHGISRINNAKIKRTVTNGTGLNTSPIVTYDTKYIKYMCSKGCKFYDEKSGCTKKRIIRVCAKKGLKNKE